MREFLRNAFALDDSKSCEPTVEQREVLEKLAAEIARRAMTGPALAFLEMSRPLNAVGSAALTFFAPFASVFATPQKIKHLAEFLEQRGSVDVLVGMIEAAEAARRSNDQPSDSVGKEDSPTDHS